MIAFAAGGTISVAKPPMAVSQGGRNEISQASLWTLAGPHIVGEPGVCTTRCSAAEYRRHRKSHRKARRARRRDVQDLIPEIGLDCERGKRRDQAGPCADGMGGICKIGQ